MLIYLKVPAGAIIYMVVSSAMRIGTQEIMFRTGMVTPVGCCGTQIGSGSKTTKADPDPPTKALGSGHWETSVQGHYGTCQGLEAGTNGTEAPPS